MPKGRMYRFRNRKLSRITRPLSVIFASSRVEVLINICRVMPLLLSMSLAAALQLASRLDCGSIASRNYSCSFLRRMRPHVNA
jgi:hypothetical protein